MVTTNIKVGIVDWSIDYIRAPVTLVSALCTQDKDICEKYILSYFCNAQQPLLKILTSMLGRRRGLPKGCLRRFGSLPRLHVVLPSARAVI